MGHPVGVVGFFSSPARADPGASRKNGAHFVAAEACPRRAEPRGAGRRTPSHLASVLQEGRKSATVHAGVRQPSWDPNRGIAPCRRGSVIGSRLWKIRAAQSRALIQGGRTMQKMTRRALGAAGLAFIVTTSAVYAQDAQPVRVRGEITKVDGNTISVKARDGQDLTVKLADNSRVAAMVKASLADIKEGSFIGVSAMPQSDGTQKAYAIHIFMDSQRGVVADRH